MKQLTLIYDGDCLLCQNFEKYVRLRKKHELVILDARKETALVSGLADRGYDINTGMILMIDDEVYVGEQALRRLDDMVESRGGLGIVSSRAVRQRWITLWLYPLGKLIRKMIFRIQGKDPKILN